jgi:hypothetical protein
MPMRRTWYFGLVLLATTAAGGALAQRSAGLTDTQIREEIVRGSVASYLATGHPCACPYNSARNGSHCGGRSAYNRPGGASPLCYPKDVSDGMVLDWKRKHGVQ